jgi:hypothetical protein
MYLLYSISPEALHLIEFIGAIISAAAIVLAFTTEYSVRRIYNSASNIVESLSTKYVGKFPENMDDIIQLIQNTRRSLTIVCDVPAYGHYSNPQGFAEYSQAIRGILISRSKPRVSIVTYSSQKRLENSKNQFNVTCQDILKSDTFRNYLEYYKDRDGFKAPVFQTKDDFSNWLEGKHTNFLREVSSYGAHIFESSIDIRAFVWISDNSAIFSFYNYGTDPREVSFKTSDQALINILTEIAKDTKASSKPYDLG